MAEITLQDVKEMFCSADDARRKGEYETAIKVLEVLIPSSQKLGDDYLTGMIYECRALSYYSKGDEDNCRSDYKSAIKHFAKAAQQGNKDALEGLKRAKQIGFDVPSISSVSNSGGSSSAQSAPPPRPAAQPAPPPFTGRKRETLPDGSVYEGEWNYGKPCGNGEMIYKDGTLYEGEFYDGRPEGRGRIKYKDGRIYLGEVFNYRPEGKGKMIHPNNKVEEGKWKDGVFKGKGLFG